MNIRLIQYLLIGVLSVGVVGMSVWSIWNGQEESRLSVATQEVQAAENVQGATGSTSVSSGAVIAEPVVIFVDVVGEVHNPGVYQFPEGARIFEAIDAAGGLTPEANIERFAYSRAARLVDEQRLHIPGEEDESMPVIISDASSGTVSAPSSNPSSSCVSVNQATISELDTLQGIGPARAQTIVDGRPYQATEDILEAGIPQSVFDENEGAWCL